MGWVLDQKLPLMQVFLVEVSPGIVGGRVKTNPKEGHHVQLYMMCTAPKHEAKEGIASRHPACIPLTKPQAPGLRHLFAPYVVHRAWPRTLLASTSQSPSKSRDAALQETNMVCATFIFYFLCFLIHTSKEGTTSSGKSHFINLYSKL